MSGVTSYREKLSTSFSFVLDKMRYIEIAEKIKSLSVSIICRIFNNPHTSNPSYTLTLSYHLFIPASMLFHQSISSPRQVFHIDEILILHLLILAPYPCFDLLHFALQVLTLIRIWLLLLLLLALFELLHIVTVAGYRGVDLQESRPARLLWQQSKHFIIFFFFCYLQARVAAISRNARISARLD